MSDTTTESPSGTDPPHTPILRTLAIATGLTAIIAVIVLAFSWPAVTADPDDVTIAVVGPEAAVSAIETQLTKEGDGVFDITRPRPVNHVALANAFAFGGQNAVIAIRAWDSATAAQ